MGFRLPRHPDEPGQSQRRKQQHFHQEASTAVDGDLFPDQGIDRKRHAQEERHPGDVTKGDRHDADANRGDADRDPLSDAQPL